MKSATVAFGLFAGLASATYHHPRHFHQYYARRNETTEAPSTTLTVAITRTQTITSCAPTVTNCPLRNNGTGSAVVTEVIDLTTTVCPATEAEKISSSVVGDHSSGLITGTTSTVAAVTTAPTPVPTGGVHITETTGVTDQTLSITVGPETSRSILVTTIHSTFTSKVTLTVPSAPVPSAPVPSAPVAESVNTEATTTITSTTTGTRTVTVPKATETATGEGLCVPAAVVTVTEPVTVYVTATIAPTTPEIKAVETPAVPAPSSTAGNQAESGAEDDSEDVVVEVTATVVPVPYPTHNGTLPSYPTAPVRK